MRISIQVFVGCLLAYATLALFLKFSPFQITRSAGDTAVDINYVDFVSLQLAIISVLLAILGFALAIFGLIGWRSIENKVNQSTNRFLEKSTSEGGEIYKLVMTAAYRGVTPVDLDDKGSDKNV